MGNHTTPSTNAQEGKSKDTARIIRAPRNADHPYFLLSRSVPQDARLSWEARGVLCYVLSKPDHWEMQVQDLMNGGGAPGNVASRTGRDKVYRILSELERTGYVRRERRRLPNGRFEWGPYIVDEYPSPEKPDMVKPLPEKPDTENQEVVKSGIQSIRKPKHPFPGLPYTENQDILDIRDREN